MVEQSLNQPAPAFVLPASVAGQEVLQVIEHNENGVLLQHFGENGQPGPELFSPVYQMGHLEARQLLFHIQGELDQSSLDIAILFGCLVPDEMPEPGASSLVVGGLQGAGGLASSGHAVEEHAPFVAILCQGRAGPAQRTSAAHEPFGLGREVGQADRRHLELAFLEPQAA